MFVPRCVGVLQIDVEFIRVFGVINSDLGLAYRAMSLGDKYTSQSKLASNDDTTNTSASVYIYMDSSTIHIYTL